MSISARAHQLQEYIKQGKILEAMDEFYDQNVTMQENNKEPIVGLAKNIEREKEFLAQVKEFKGYDAIAVGIDGDVSLVECTLDFVNQQDQPVHLSQVAVQRWKDGKVISEKFYYDASGG